VAAGAIGFEDAVPLVNERGDAMQEAAEDSAGIMLALSGVDDEMARIACRRADGDVWLANSNAPGECVIAGRPEVARRAVDIARELGATRVSEVAVSGAFHTPLMTPAQPRLRKALEGITFYPLAVPVVANVDALPHDVAHEWPSLLSAQLRTPEWDGDALFCELGPGGPLSAMVRATVPEAITVAIAVPDDLDTLVETLTGEPAGAEPASTGTATSDGHQGERLYVSERLIISPGAGVFELPGDELRAGRSVQIGDLIGSVSGTEVRSPFAGELMGVLAHPGERVHAGQPIAWLRSR
jgi:[acyl-carrier-protein] S-malonyltransferase